MRTIGKKWPRNARGDYAANCSYCGVLWRRSQLTKDAAGNFVCPDEGPGLDAVTLSRENAMGAQERPQREAPDGLYQKSVGYPESDGTAPADPGQKTTRLDL